MRRSRDADTNATESGQPTNANTDSSPSRRRDRGLGPFSGGQLTIIIVTLAVLMLVPIGAWAVAGTNSFVTDATTGVHANVSAGALNVHAASPKQVITKTVPLDGTVNPPKVFAPSSGHAAVVTSIEVAAGDADLVVIFLSATNNTCADSSPAFPILVAMPMGLSSTSVDLGPGLVVPANRALCAGALGENSWLTAFAYLIPGASAPSGAAVGVPASQVLAAARPAAAKAHVQIP